MVRKHFEDNTITFEFIEFEPILSIQKLYEFYGHGVDGMVSTVGMLLTMLHLKVSFTRV